MITELIASLRLKIGDTKTPYVFPDDELTRELTEALYRYSPLREYSTIREPEKQFIVKLAWISLCYILASDHAKYYGLSIAGMSIEKSSPFNNYLQLAQYLETKIKEEIDNSDADSVLSSMGQITMGQFTRTSVETRTTVPYTADVPPEVTQVKLNHINGLIVSIEWLTTYANDFYQYEVWRSSISTNEGTLVAEITDNHTITYDDTVPTSGEYYYRIKVRDNNDLSSVSNIIKVVAA